MSNVRRHMRVQASVASVLFCAVSLASCDSGSHPPQVVSLSTPVVLSQSIEIPTEQDQFKAALSRAGIPFNVKTLGGREFVQWDAQSASAVAGIQSSLFGPELPSGRNYGASGPHHEQFKQWLTATEFRSLLR